MIAHPPRPDQGSAPTPRWAAAPRSGGRWWVRDRENESRHPGFERRALHWYIQASSQRLGSARGLFCFTPPSRWGSSRDHNCGPSSFCAISLALGKLVEQNENRQTVRAWQCRLTEESDARIVRPCHPPPTLLARRPAAEIYNFKHFQRFLKTDDFTDFKDVLKH